jgi:hypothetical protein
MYSFWQRNHIVVRDILSRYEFTGFIFKTELLHGSQSNEFWATTLSFALTYHCAIRRTLPKSGSATNVNIIKTSFIYTFWQGSHTVILRPVNLLLILLSLHWALRSSGFGWTLGHSYTWHLQLSQIRWSFSFLVSTPQEDGHQQRMFVVNDTRPLSSGNLPCYL